MAATSAQTKKSFLVEHHWADSGDNDEFSDQTQSAETPLAALLSVFAGTYECLREANEDDITDACESDETAEENRLVSVSLDPEGNASFWPLVADNLAGLEVKLSFARERLKSVTGALCVLGDDWDVYDGETLIEKHHYYWSAWKVSGPLVFVKCPTCKGAGKVAA